jgi:hypothetical protein
MQQEKTQALLQPFCKKAEKTFKKISEGKNALHSETAK